MTEVEFDGIESGGLGDPGSRGMRGDQGQVGRSGFARDAEAERIRKVPRGEAPAAPFDAAFATGPA